MDIKYRFPNDKRNKKQFKHVRLFTTQRLCNAITLAGSIDCTYVRVNWSMIDFVSINSRNLNFFLFVSVEILKYVFAARIKGNNIQTSVQFFIHGKLYTILLWNHCESVPILDLRNISSEFLVFFCVKEYEWDSYPLYILWRNFFFCFSTEISNGISVWSDRPAESKQFSLCYDLRKIQHTIAKIKENEHNIYIDLLRKPSHQSVIFPLAVPMFERVNKSCYNFKTTTITIKSPFIFLNSIALKIKTTHPPNNNNNAAHQHTYRRKPSSESS